MNIVTILRNIFVIEGEGKWLGGDGRKKQIDNLYLFGVVLALTLFYFLKHASVFLDDVFIYFRVAKNIVQGAGPVMNPGDGFFPVTSPLWVFMLALSYKISGMGDLVLISKLLSTLLLALASLLAFLSLRRYLGSWAVLTPLPIFFNFITTTTVGGEIPLVYAGLFGVLWAYFVKRNFVLTGFFAAVAYLARAELILLLPILVLHYVLEWKKENKSFAVMARDWGKWAGVFLMLVAIWHIYYFIHFFTLFPNTLHTKTIQGKSGMWKLYYSMGRPIVMDIFRGIKILIIPLLFGLIYCRALSLSLLGFTILHYYAYKCLSIPYYHWYYYDFFVIIPMFTLFGMIAFFLTMEKLIGSKVAKVKQGFRFPFLFKMVGTLVLLVFSGILLTITTKINIFHTYKNDSRLKSYKEIADSIHPLVHPGDVLLASEIGIVGYYLDNVVIRDVCGIASTDVTVENINDLDYFVHAYEPRFIFFLFSMNQKSPRRTFTGKNWQPVAYQLEYPKMELTTPINCIFSRSENGR